IAYVTDKNVNDLVRYNELSAPYTIFPGQRLKLWAPKYVAPKYGHKVEPVVAPVVAAKPAPVTKTSTTSKASNSSKSSTQKPKTTTTQVAQKQPPKKVEQSKPKEYVGSKGNQN
ncbi:LysM peptidoglycan-binding domain-containing protein, partial [Vibrio harveyi]